MKKRWLQTFSASSSDAKEIYEDCEPYSRGGEGEEESLTLLAMESESEPGGPEPEALPNNGTREDKERDDVATALLELKYPDPSLHNLHPPPGKRTMATQDDKDSDETQEIPNKSHHKCKRVKVNVDEGSKSNYETECEEGLKIRLFEMCTTPGLNSQPGAFSSPQPQPLSSVPLRRRTRLMSSSQGQDQDHQEEEEASEVEVTTGNMKRRTKVRRGLWPGIGTGTGTGEPLEARPHIPPAFAQLGQVPRSPQLPTTDDENHVYGNILTAESPERFYVATHFQRSQKEFLEGVLKYVLIRSV